MSDQSHLDQRYFVDANAYNCPFCNRRHVLYQITGHHEFDWTNEKRCAVFFVRCNSCLKESMHLTFEEVDFGNVYRTDGTMPVQFDVPNAVDAGEFLDEAFFYSVPTSFFVLDTRVPRILRELLTEAEACLKMNLLTGGSACARKIVYELAGRAIDGNEEATYEDRIKSLKDAYPEVDPTYFDTLLTVHQVTSSKVHENSYDGWEANHLRLILATLREVLHEIYVAPKLREDRRKSVIKLKEDLLPNTGAESSDDIAD